jgi:hypothetical protein
MFLNVKIPYKNVDPDLVDADFFKIKKMLFQSLRKNEIIHASIFFGTNRTYFQGKLRS